MGGKDKQPKPQEKQESNSSFNESRTGVLNVTNTVAPPPPKDKKNEGK